MKYYYRIYGLNIESTVEICELEVINKDCSIDARLYYGEVDDDIKLSIKNGHNTGYDKDSMWFNIEVVAIYHIYGGDTILIQPYDNSSFNQIKLYILGSVMGMLLLQKNIVAIHGGGIVINGKGCIFTGEKGAGKSTITTALRKKGYKFLADDVCSIADDNNLINYGFPYQKICEDAMLQLGYNIDEFVPFRGDLDINKYMVPAFDDFTKQDVQLNTIFEISVGEVNKVEIEEIKGAHKINKLIDNIFRVEVIGYSGGMDGLYFKKCLNIAKNIKMYKIIRPKGIFSVKEQIEIIEEMFL